MDDDRGSDSHLGRSRRAWILDLRMREGREASIKHYVGILTRYLELPMKT